jgi:class 3 adenylate cyclase
VTDTRAGGPGRFRTHPLFLSFPEAATEWAWWADFGAENLRFVRGSIALLAAVFSIFVLNDVVVFRDHLPALLFLRFGVIVPLLAAGWVLAGTETGAEIVRTYVQEYLLVLSTVGCGGMLAMSGVLIPDATPERAWIASLGFAIALVGVYGFSRLRFLYAVLLGVATTLAAMSLMPHFATPDAPTRLLLAPFAVAMNVSGAWMTRTRELLGRRAFAERELLAEERARSEALLRNALPVVVAERLRGLGPEQRAIADRYEEVTVVLADVVDFTPLCERLAPEEIAALLDRLFTRFDALCAAHGVEKIKTLGDAWLAAGGVPVPRPDHAVAAARLALAMRDAAAEAGPGLRIGLHTGPAVAGVVGRTRFAYDLWGDAVTGAQAMERASRPGGIRVSARAADRLGFQFVLARDEEGWWLLRERQEPDEEATEKG